MTPTPSLPNPSDPDTSGESLSVPHPITDPAANIDDTIETSERRPRRRLGTLSDLGLSDLDHYRPRAVRTETSDLLDVVVSLASERALGIDLQNMQVKGQGAMAYVFAASQTMPGMGSHLVAIKVSKFPSDTPEGEAFLREATQMKKFEHPHIPKVADFGVLRTSNLPYYITPLIQGETLAEVFEGWRTNPNTRTYFRRTDNVGREILVYICQAADALTYSHNQGILHRDIKPSNVIFSTNQAYVLDYGMLLTATEQTEFINHSAYSSDQGSSITPRGGSPLYMAPEQHAGDVAALGPRTDVWGLGITLLEALGNTPPPRLCELDDSDKIITDYLESNASRVPSPLHSIVRKACKRDPTQRYPTPQEFRDDVSRFLKGVPVRARLEELLLVDERIGYRATLAIRTPLENGVIFVKRHVVGVIVGTISTVVATGGLVFGYQILEKKRKSESNAAVAKAELVTKREGLVAEARQVLLTAGRLAEQDDINESIKGISHELLNRLYKHFADSRVEFLTEALTRHRNDYGKFIDLQRDVNKGYLNLAASLDPTKPRPLSACVPNMKEAVAPYFLAGGIDRQNLGSFQKWLASSALLPKHRELLGDWLLEALIILEFQEHRHIYLLGKPGSLDVEERDRRLQYLSYLDEIALATASDESRLNPYRALHYVRSQLYRAAGDPDKAGRERALAQQEETRPGSYFIFGLLLREDRFLPPDPDGPNRIIYLNDLGPFQAANPAGRKHLGALECMTQILAERGARLGPDEDPRPAIANLLEATRSLASMDPNNPYFQIRVTLTTYRLWRAERILPRQIRSSVNGGNAVKLEAAACIKLCKASNVPVPTEVYLSAGECHAADSSFQSAIKHLKEAFIKDKERPDIQVRLGTALAFGSHKFGEIPGFSEVIYKQALNKGDFEDPDVFLDVVAGCCWVASTSMDPKEQGRFLDLAISQLSEAIKRVPYYKEVAKRYSENRGWFKELKDLPKFKELIN